MGCALAQTGFNLSPPFAFSGTPSVSSLNCIPQFAYSCLLFELHHVSIVMKMYNEKRQEQCQINVQ